MHSIDRNTFVIQKVLITTILSEVGIKLISLLWFVQAAQELWLLVQVNLRVIQLNQHWTKGGCRPQRNVIVSHDRLSWRSEQLDMAGDRQA